MDHSSRIEPNYIQKIQPYMDKRRGRGRRSSKVDGNNGMAMSNAMIKIQPITTTAGTGAGTKDEGIGTTGSEPEREQQNQIPIPVLIGNGNRREKRIFSKYHHHQSKHHHQAPQASRQALAAAESAESEADNFVPKNSVAPSPECLVHYASHLASNDGHLGTMEQQCKVIEEKVQEELFSIHPRRGMGLTVGAIGIIFDLSQKLKVHESVKYAACELYDLYSIKFHETVMPTLVARLADQNDKIEIMDRLRNQSLLRFGSCIQLASKMYQPGVYGSFVSSVALKQGMQALNYNYSLDVINSSEKRVLQMLDHQLYVVTTFDVIENILLHLGFSRNDYRRAYHLSFQILEFVVVHKEKLYQRFYESLCKKYPSYSRMLFRTQIEFSKLVQASFVVGSAITIFKPLDDPAYRYLERAPGINLEDILEFSTITLKFILQTKPSVVKGEEGKGKACGTPVLAERNGNRKKFHTPQ